MGSFAPAPAAPVVDIPLSLFSGMDPELNPADCPEGISPDNQDMQYKPGSTDSRDGLHKLFNAPLAGTPTIVYQKTYVQQNGQSLTLVLDSNGVFWQENVAIGAVTQFGSVPPGLYAQSVTAFGREYIAVSDLLHGQGVPLQYDGTHLDRVSQDGPGAPPFVSDLSQLYAIGGLGSLQIVVDGTGIQSITEIDNVVTVVLNGNLTAAQGGQVGDFIVISGVTPTAYNGTWQLTGSSVLPNTPGNRFQYVNTTTGLAPGTGGGMLAQFYFIQVATVPATPIVVGQNIVIAGATNASYDGTYPVRAVINPNLFLVPIISAGQISLPNSGNGTVSIVGLIAPGTHQVVVMFLTRQGYLTKPSPPFAWVAAGGLEALVSNLPIGPSNVVARVLGLTGAGGGNFFTLTATPQVAGQVVGTALIIPDNTSMQAVINLSDTTLFAGIAIDQDGNDLFDQVVLGPCAGFFSYSSRLFPWGEYNKVQNFLNLGFCGGYLTLNQPLGWNLSGTFGFGGILVNGGPWAGGQSWQITGDGSANPRGEIFQSAYRDYLGDAILEPNTAYSLRFWAQASGAGLFGTVVATLSSVLTGYSSTAQIAIANLSTSGAFTALLNFSLILPATIPPDLILTLYAINLNNGAAVTLSELETIFTANPYMDTVMRASYAINPEAFAATTGTIGAEDDPSPIRSNSLQRASVLLKTAEGTHIFQANDFEPNQWPVNPLSRSVGTCSLRAGDPGRFGTGDAAEDWDLSFNQNGLYLFAGGDFWKVSQEMQPQIDAINWAAQASIWVKNDVKTRRAYMGVPVNGATAPNLILVMDYRELDTATQIANSPPVHISLSGKMICSDLTRKWSRWNIQANTAEVILRQGNLKQFVLGGGNGQTPGAAPGFGNLYYLDPAKLTDDDYGQIFPYYTTYGFVNHDQEQALGIGSHRKLEKKVAMFATGVGYVYFTPLVDSLQNALPASTYRQLSLNTNPGNALGQDLEWTTAIRGERIFHKIQVAPLGGTTDVKLSLQKLIVTMTQDPIAVMRSSRL